MKKQKNKLKSIEFISRETEQKRNKEVITSIKQEQAVIHKK